MKLSSIALTIATAGSFVAAQPHKHHHRHLEKREATATKAVNGPVVTMYKLGDKNIDYDEAMKGIAEHRYVVDNGALKAAPSTSTPSPTPTSTANVQQQASSNVAASSSSYPANNAVSASSASASQAASSTSASAAASSSAASSGSDSNSGSSSSSGSSSGGPSGGQGLDRDFDDGNVDCSHFPSDYGAISIDWMKLGGWSGIQYMSGNDVSSTAVAGNTCTGDAMCSYACPPGYQKSQWPLDQPASQRSVGGLQCKNGKLHLTNPGLSKKLCIKGVGGVTIVNKLKTNSAVCRTDYPGTESETVPLDTQSGQTHPLTCPDAGSYYKAKYGDGHTSAQYYVNPAGVSVSDACRWGDSSKPWGNFAPVNLGVGKRDGAIWASITQNSPTTNAKLDFNVQLQGDLSCKCKYNSSTGLYEDDNGTNPNGCTVKVMSGDVTFVFS
ncbi:MAG: hypothetical protein M1835_008187 [Candelina submexicana]|nr:MAG: hypothetical protein M1835_008187 [Candelina submexicana]